MITNILNPLHTPHWNNLLLSHSRFPFFLTSEWARVLYSTYHYTPLYLVSIRNDSLTALVPMMEMNSLITGRRGVSLPFTDMCEWIVSPECNRSDLTGSVENLAVNRGWKYYEFRDVESNSMTGEHTAHRYIHHTLDLSPGFDTLHSRFRSRAKRNIKRALAEGITIVKSRSTESLEEFYRIHCQTRKHHGVPPQPKRFFRAIHEHVLKNNMGWIFKAVHHNKVVSACVYFHFDKGVIYKFGATSQSDSHLGASYLVMNDAIKWYTENGYSDFSFGRTEISNTGLLQFKDSWGSDRSELYYYRHYLHEGISQYNNPVSTRFMTRVFQHTPIPILRLAGEITYKHIG